jgi:hypothetical protein
MAQVSSLDRLGGQSVRPGRRVYLQPKGKRRAAIRNPAPPRLTRATWAVIHLTEWAEHDPLRTAASVYLYLSDADALYAEWKALENLEGRLIPPRDTPYGLREFAYVDPEGTAHRIGSPLTP